MVTEMKGSCICGLRSMITSLFHLIEIVDSFTFVFLSTLVSCFDIIIDLLVHLILLLLFRCSARS